MEIEFSDDANGPGAAPANSAKHELEEFTFLVIDDSGVQRKFITNALVDCGIQKITETKDAVDGLSLLRDPAQHVDIILVDQEMPILDGTQFTQMVRNDASLPDPNIPIIMVTSHTNTSHFAGARKAGIDGFVAKPFTPETMRTQVMAILDGRSLRTAKAPAKHPLKHPPKEQKVAGLTCLIIDDSEFTRKLICRSLRTIGIDNILQAADGVAGLSILREKIHPIDVILVDREMPIFDGIEFSRMVRHDEALQGTHIPIVMVSGLVDKKHILDAKNAGVSAFVPKPFSTQDIDNQIRAALKDPHNFIEAKRDE